MVRLMSSVLLLRFPDGDVEYRSTLADIVEGTRVRARGTSWRVRSINGLTVTLEAVEADAPDGASARTGGTPRSTRGQAADVRDPRGSLILALRAEWPAGP